MSMEFSESATDALRGGFVLAGENGGPIATVADFDVETSLDARFVDDPQQAIANYVDPGKRFSLEEQYCVNTQFLFGAMGLQAPAPTELSARQSNRLEQAYDRVTRNPGLSHYRLVIAPLFASDNRLLENRHNMIQQVGKNFPETSTASARWGTFNDSFGYGSLLQNPDGGTTSGLRYLANGNIFRRQDYLDYLNETGVVVVGSADTLWTYSFTDIRQRTPRTTNYATIKQLHEKLGLTNAGVASPEHEFAIRALHIAAGNSPIPDVNILNEAIYNLGEKGRPTAVGRVAAVENVVVGPYSYLNLDSWPVTHDTTLRNDLGLRGSVNAL